MISPLAALEVFLNRPFTSSEKPQVTLYASGEGTVFLRLYRIDDVHGYLNGQGNAHTVSEKNERLMQPGYFLWRSVVENLEHALYQLARRYMRANYRERLRRELGLEKYAFPFRDRFPETNLFAPLPYPIVAEQTIVVRARHWQALKHEFAQLAPGYYLVEASQGRHIAHSPLVVSDIAMVTKTSPHNILVYAINLKTGEPLTDGLVTAYVRAKQAHQKKLSFALKDGLAFTEKTGFLNGAESTVYVLEHGKHFAFTDVYAIDATRGLYEAAIYTDRPVYRMGDTVHVRAVFVRKQAAAAHGKVKYRIRNNDNEIIYSGEGELSPAGSLAFTYKTGSLKPARYTIQMELEGETHSGSFLMEQYKKPETRATMSAEKRVLLAGEVAEVTLSAAYYSGEALSNVRAEITIERARISYPWWYGFPFEEYYGDSYDYMSWEFVKDYTATLDNAGKLKIALPTDARADADYHYRVRATVKAQNREEAMASARFKVYRAPVSLRLSQDRWYFSGQMPIGFRVSATQVLDQKPAQISVTAELIRREYDSKTKKYNDTRVASLELKTNELGEAVGEFAPVQRGGVYLVRVTGSLGNRVTSDSLETYVYHAGDFYADSAEQTERPIAVSPGKKKYALYETAEFAVRLPVQKKMPVLITLENDRIRKYQLIPASDAQFLHSEELKSFLTPNFEVVVTALDYDKYPRYYSGSAQVVLPPEHRMMKVEVVADRERYRPGEEANLLVKTFDHKGRPVSAEFSLGLVDEAIYAVREDFLTSLSLALNPRLPYAVVTGTSLQFSFYGYGAEKSLYALYREQMAEAAAMRKGVRNDVRVRKDFRDTAFFTAHGKTGENGIGRLAVTLPDNLTEWRITAHAHTSAGLAGSARSKLIVSKDFALRIAQPRFLRERDEARLRLLVSNQLKEPQTAAFETAFSALKVAAPFPAKLTIPAQSERYVDFTVAAPVYPENGQATVKVIARSEKEHDGLQIQLPILPYGVENYVASQKIFGDTERSWSTTLKLDADARTDLAEMQLSFTPGVLPSVLETLPYLITYPYGCVEQTLSTFLPATWAGEAAKKLKLPLPVKQAQLQEITEQGLKKLYGYQHADGGWGWWSEDATDVYMSAYTLWGLSEAKRAGIAVDDNVLRRGEKYLAEQLSTATTRDLKDGYALNRLLFAQMVQIELQKKSPLSEKIRAEWKSLLSGGIKDPYALALIVQGATAAAWTEIASAAIDRLALLKKTHTQGSYFEQENARAWYWMSDREEITAQVLYALQVAGENKKIAQRELISYLIAQKKERRWRSTKLSALITRAFAQWAVTSGESLRKVRVRVEVDGERRDVVYDPRKSSAADLLLSFRTKAREARVKLSRDSEGFFLARAEWKHYLVKPLLAPREGNFALSRKFFAVERSGNSYRKGAASYSFKAGDLVMTEVDLKAEKGAEYLLLEDMIPAGFEPLGPAEMAQMGNLRYDGYENAPAAVTRLDDRVALAKTWMAKDHFVPRAFYRAVFPGKYQVMPAQGGLMYYPETFAYSASDVITISE
jgi:uncharacterized protein YfaS (alpha-2-macroglobulin family)